MRRRPSMPCRPCCPRLPRTIDPTSPGGRGKIALVEMLAACHADIAMPVMRLKDIPNERKIETPKKPQQHPPGSGFQAAVSGGSNTQAATALDQETRS